MTIEVKVEKRGEVVVEEWNARIVAGSKESGILAAIVELSTKRALFTGTICSSDDEPEMICLGADAETMHRDIKRNGESTIIYFPELPGWRTHCADVSKYTLSICMIAPEAK